MKGWQITIAIATIVGAGALLVSSKMPERIAYRGWTIEIQQQGPNVVGFRAYSSTARMSTVGEVMSGGQIGGVSPTYAEAVAAAKRAVDKAMERTLR